MFTKEKSGFAVMQYVDDGSVRGDQRSRRRQHEDGLSPEAANAQRAER